MDKDGTFGAAFVGFTVSVLLLGILTAQVSTYHIRYPHDRPVYKFLVIFVWALEATHSALNCHSLYIYVVSDWGNPLVFIERPVWSIVAQVPLGAFIGVIVKGCYAMRVWRFSQRNPWITWAIILSIIVQYGFALWFTINAYRFGSLANAGVVAAVGNTSLGLGAFTDIFTAMALCWYLRKLKTGSKQADTLITRLTLYAINTGLLGSAIGSACLVTYAVLPHKFIFIALYFVQIKLYANSFLATLNTRQGLKGRGMDDSDEKGAAFRMVLKPGIRLPQLRYGSDGPESADSPEKSDFRSPGFHVNVHREISVKSDNPNHFNPVKTQFSEYSTNW